MRRISFLILFSFAACVLAVSATAQDASTATQPTGAAAESVDEIVVRGQRMADIEFNLQRYVMEFVTELTASPPGRGFARWQRRLCVGVHNLENTAAQYLVDRISQLAMEVGLEPGEPGCAPQAMIIFTTDANDTATQLVTRNRTQFRPAGGVGGMNLGLAELDEFMQSDRAVRWWHVALPVDARTGQAAIPLRHNDGPPMIAVAGPSRIYSGIRDDLQSVIIIVDTSRLGRMTWQQLGDYLAVVALAQVDPNSDLSAFDTILNLFRTPQYYSGLTDWDRSFLMALYEFNQERLPQLQRGSLVNRMMVRERAADADSLGGTR